MKIIRTFSYLEIRSDYLFYLSIQILIARNEIASDKDFPYRRLTPILLINHYSFFGFANSR